MLSRRQAAGVIVAAALIAIPALGFAVSARAVGTLTVSGRLLGLPKHQRGLAVFVEAVSLDNGEVASAETVSGSRYSLGVSAGPYLILETVLDPRRRRRRVAYKAVMVSGSRGSVNLTVHAASAGLPAARAAAGTGTDVAIGNVPIFAPEGRLGGGAEAGLMTGMLPICHSNGGKVFDHTTAFDHAIAVEQELAAKGQLGFGFNYQPGQATLSVTGSVSTGPNGGPLADLTVTNLVTGKVVKHYRIADDPGSWDNLGGFERHLGAGVADNIANEGPCDGPKLTPPPPPPPGHTCFAKKGTVCVTFDASVTGNESSPSLFATSRSDTVGWELEWSSSTPGYGVPNQLDSSSNAFGHGDVTYQSPQPACATGFALDPFNSPSLAQGPPFGSTSELTIMVPNPVEDSAGGGTGNPAIKDTNSSCPALIGGLPGNYTKTVPLHPGTYTLPIPKTTYPFSGAGKSGSSTIEGTITITVG
jgi:hypothetical protein